MENQPKKGDKKLDISNGKEKEVTKTPTPMTLPPSPFPQRLAKKAVIPQKCQSWAKWEILELVQKLQLFSFSQGHSWTI